MMKNKLPLFLLTFLLGIQTQIFSQEFESDLFDFYFRNTIQSFWESPYNQMKITTFNVKNNEKIEELNTTYKKSKLSTFKVNYTTIYSKYYLLEDRKKSSGQYNFLSDGHIRSYNRTDISRENIMIGTMYINFTYNYGLIQKEDIRYKEYKKVGATELDSIVTKDSIIYIIESKENQIIQKNSVEKETQTVYFFEGKKLIEKQNQFPGFKEIYIYQYNSQSKISKIEINLKSNEGTEIKNLYLIEYNTDGYIQKIQYFDQKNILIEEKLFNYK